MHARWTVGRLAAALIAVSAVASASSAHALSLYAGGLAGYAQSTDQEHDVNPYAVALGASAGITLPIMPIYVGGRFVYYFGDSASFSEDGAGLKLDAHYVMYGLDLGYDAELGPIVLRPALGIGRATLESTSTGLGGTDVSKSDSSLYLAPSIGLIIKLGLIYASGELRYNALTEGDQPDSVSMLAGLGLTI
jgi:hypothetical protein